MAEVAVNSFEKISDIAATVWVDPDLDVGDRLIGVIAPSVFRLDPHDGKSRTHFGNFMGSTDESGQPGLRPVLAVEYNAVVRAADKTSSENVFVEETLMNPPEELWRYFLANSAYNMIEQATRTVGHRPPEGRTGRYLSTSELVADIISPEPVVVLTSEELFDPANNMNKPVIARIDVLSLLGIEISTDARTNLSTRLVAADASPFNEGKHSVVRDLHALRDKIEPHLAI